MGHDLVLLLECRDGLEAASVKGLLESAGIGCVVQGEHHASLLGGTTMPTPIAPRVLVQGPDLERAMTVLEGARQGQESATCAVHERPGTRRCEGCGVAMCEACEGARCESCAPAPEKATGWLAALAVPALLLVLVLLLMEYLGVVPD